MHKGGINGRKIRHLLRDDQYQVSSTIANANELIDKDNALALLVNLRHRQYRRIAAAENPRTCRHSAGRRLHRCAGDPRAIHAADPITPVPAITTR